MPQETLNVKAGVQEVLGGAQLKALNALGYFFELQQEVLEFELAFVEDVLRFIRRRTSPPTA